MEEELRRLEIYPEEGMIVLTRKLMEGRSVCKINGETVNLQTMKEVASILIDIHGQHEHQTLLHKKNHLALLDLYAGEAVFALKEEVAAAYRTYQAAKKQMEASKMDEQSRLREISLAEYEVQEIEDAALLDGEEEELDHQYRRMTQGKRYTESIAETYQYTSQSHQANASDLLSRAIRSFQDVADSEEDAGALYQQLLEIDALLNDFNRDLSEYQKSFDFSEEDFYETETRFHLIQHLKAKYGNSVEEITAYCEEKKRRLTELRDYEQYIAQLEDTLAKAQAKLDQKSKKLSKVRREVSKQFEAEITAALHDLHFLDVQFELRFEQLQAYHANGIDEAQFYISTNPGEPIKALDEVASGGELSRIMLAIKSILADKEDTPTLIFDEIDTGISGITAGKVAEKMHKIAENRQVLCITHLPQIASYADAHYLIQKQVQADHTQTSIVALSYQDSVQELARLLGGANITDTILESAKEMKAFLSSDS
jgi:DNA repair protein RecN (Recombination protein N)